MHQIASLTDVYQLSVFVKHLMMDVFRSGSVFGISVREAMQSARHARPETEHLLNNTALARLHCGKDQGCPQVHTHIQDHTDHVNE